jgi:hypothetical protein
LLSITCSEPLFPRLLFRATLSRNRLLITF